MLTYSVADKDPGSGAFLTPGSGIGRKSASGSGIRDEQPGSYFLELRNHFFVFFGLKYLNSLMRIRDGKKSDQHPGSATLFTYLLLGALSPVLHVEGSRTRPDIIVVSRYLFF
jgi:hypothetical protein